MDALDAEDFLPRASVPSLADDEVHVWSACVDATLSPSRIGAAALALLTRLLCGYAGCKAAPQIERSEHGKPFAPALPDLEFNLSHAGPRLLIAFARKQPLGIDLERTQRQLSIDGVARRFFASDEADVLALMPEARKRAAFVRLWTQKEAVLKAIGIGLGFGLARVEFGFTADGEVGALRQIDSAAGNAREWIVQRVDPWPGHVGALAWRGPLRRVRAFAWQPDSIVCDEI